MTAGSAHQGEHPTSTMSSSSESQGCVSPPADAPKFRRSAVNEAALESTQFVFHVQVRQAQDAGSPSLSAGKAGVRSRRTGLKSSSGTLNLSGPNCSSCPSGSYSNSTEALSSPQCRALPCPSS